jgi:hypothetical protein
MRRGSIEKHIRSLSNIICVLTAGVTGVHSQGIERTANGVVDCVRCWSGSSRGVLRQSDSHRCGSNCESPDKTDCADRHPARVRARSSPCSDALHERVETARVKVEVESKLGPSDF